MPKIAEKLTILGKTGDALLLRLVHTKQVLNDANLKPAFLADNNNIKILANVIKKFPEITDLPTLDQVLAAGIEHMPRLEVYYDSIVDTMLFAKASIEAIEEVTNSIPIFKLEKNPVLTIAFLDLFSLVARNLITLNQINDRKQILVVYSKLYERKSQKTEENYSETAIFMSQFENPFKRLQTILSEQANQSIGHSLIDTMTPFLAGYTVDHLRNTGVLSLSFAPGKMCLPPTTLDHLILKHSAKILMWVSYGFLVTPEHFSMPEPLEILKVALQQSYLTPCYGSEVAYLHELYETIMSTHKSPNKQLQKQLKKDKKVFADTLMQSLQPAFGIKHRNDRRLYVRHELRQLLLLVKDFPGLLGPKIEMVWGVLSIAKEEIFWYFNHKTKPAPKSVAKLYQAKNYSDPHIGEIVSYILEMVDLIKYYKEVIQEYYVSYLKGCDFEKLTTLVQEVIGRGGNKIADILNSILNDIQTFTLDSVNGKQFNFQALRLNWFRVETWLSSPSCPCGSLDINNELTKRMFLILHHTKNIDSIEEQIEEYSSLSGLIQFPNTIIQEFELSLTSSQASHSLTWIRLITTFPTQVNEYISEEKEKYGLASVFMAQKCIGKLTTKIGELLQNIIDHHIKIDGQLDPIPFVQPINIKSTPAPLPQIAAESYGKNRTVLLDLRNSFNILYRIISTLRSYSSYLCVHDQSFYPISFLRETLIDLFRSFIVKNLTLPPEKDQPVSNIHRPSVILKKINIARHVLSTLEDHIPFNIHILINDVIFGLIYNHIFDSEDPLAWVTVKDLPPLSPLILPISEWYFDFVNRRMEYGAVIYSPIRKSFVSRTTFKVDDYCSTTELQSLVTLVGPLGIKLIDRQFLDLIAKNIAGIKDHLQTNIDDLREISNTYTTDQCIAAVKRIKDLEGFVTKAKTIGNCLAFRGLLAEALEKQTHNSIPFIYSSVKLQIAQNKESLLPEKELQLIEEIAHSVGIPVHFSDLPLDIILGNVAQSSPDLWNLLPYMFAASFIASAWSNISYKPTIDAYPNNTHVLALTFGVLLARMVPLSSKTDPETVRNLFVKFIDVSSNILLRLVKLPQRELQKKGVAVNIPSAIMFLDIFMQTTPLLTYDVLEKVLPYSLVRSMCHDFYVSDVKDIRDDN